MDGQSNVCTTQPGFSLKIHRNPPSGLRPISHSHKPDTTVLIHESGLVPATHHSSQTIPSMPAPIHSAPPLSTNQKAAGLQMSTATSVSKVLYAATRRVPRLSCKSKQGSVLELHASRVVFWNLDCIWSMGVHRQAQRPDLRSIPRTCAKASYPGGKRQGSTPAATKPGTVVLGDGTCDFHPLAVRFERFVIKSEYVDGGPRFRHI